MKLGWRNPRVNDFHGPDAAAARAVLGDLQKYMTWPHFRVSVDAAQVTSNSFSTKNITKLEDPYGLLIGSNTIRVPSAFSSYLFVGFVNIRYAAAGAGLYQAGFRVDGSILDHLVGDHYSAGVQDMRATLSPIVQVNKGQALTVCGATPAASTVQAGRANGFFLPLV